MVRLEPVGGRQQLCVAEAGVVRLIAVEVEK